MTLKLQSNLLAWLACVTVAVILSVLSVFVVKVHRQTEQIRITENTAKAITHFRFLIMETALYRDPRSGKQWLDRIASLRLLLASQQYGDPAQAGLLDKQKANLKIIAPLYARLLSADSVPIATPHANSDALERTAMTVSALYLTTQDMFDDTFELLRLNRLDLDAAHLRLAICMLASILALAGLIVATYLINLRRVLAPIALLQQGTEQVMRGDLTHRIDLAIGNELGVLATTFNQMTTQLSGSYQSLQRENAERQHAQHELERTVQRLAQKSRALSLARDERQTIIDHMPAVVVYWDKQLLNRFANTAYLDWFGVTPQQMLGRHIRDVNGAEHFSRIAPFLNSALAGNTEIFELPIVLPDGSERHALISYVPDRVDGEIVGIYGFLSNISQLKQAQKAEAEASLLLESIVDAASDFSIIATDMNGIVTLFSRGAQRMLGYTAAEIVGRCSPANFHVADEVIARASSLSEQYGVPVAGFEVFVHLARQNLSETREWTYVRKDGSTLPIHLTVTAVRDQRHQIIGFAGIANDIHAEKAIRKSLAAARDQAEAASLAKSQFLANMSHEIRTPMNAILGMLQLLQYTGLTPQQRDYAFKSESAARSLLGLINDILDFSKLGADKMSLESVPFSLDTLVRDLSVILSANAVNKDVEILFSVDPRLPAFLQGDAQRLQQILLNLAGNAVKFTLQGTVDIAIRQINDYRDATDVAFSVSDTGIGIAADKLTTIFEMFSQAEASTSRRFGGTGLGLTISQRLVSLMGGSLVAESEEGVGSRFSFNAMFEKVASADVRTSFPAPVVLPRSRALTGLRLLVIDDNLINQQVAQELLSEQGALVDVADGGIAGAARVFAASPCYDAVLMDIQMPDMDGYETTRQIRLDLRMQALPIIAMTANVMSGDREACLRAGMNDHIGKPISIDELVRTLLRHCAEIQPEDVMADPGAGGWDVPRQHADTAAIELERALQRLGGNRSLFLNIAGKFGAEARTMVANLRDALDGANYGAAADILHTLKSTAGTVGAQSLAELAAALELACRGPNPALDIAVVTRHIERCLTSCLASLDVIRLQLSSSADLVALQSDDIAKIPLVILLDRLDAYLQDANMEALDVFTMIETSYHAELGDDLVPLSSSLSRLNFKLALESSRRLRSGVP
ncbi:ATP-binding protein [Actimicrobium antarcticum]|uniref:histidine kinase n=1 Tax=Actimicrobium antarcticum TaxID=1051899 RepID=A0ABP7U2B4_9BURK